MNLLVRRLTAWMIDWMIIITYAALLFGVVMLLMQYNIVPIESVHPLQGQLIGFTTLTLPVMLYCIFMEQGASHATIGKRAMKLVVSGNVNTQNIVLRNVTKFLPWEFAHAGVLWINYIKEAETPLWIWLLLLVPQVLVFVYLIAIIISKGSKSVYDYLAGTHVEIKV